jgi:hypothetical protein
VIGWCTFVRLRLQQAEASSNLHHTAVLSMRQTRQRALCTGSVSALFDQSTLLMCCSFGKPDGFGQLVLDTGTDVNPVLLEGVFDGAADGKPSLLLGPSNSRVMPFKGKYADNLVALAKLSNDARLAPYLDPMLHNWKVSVLRKS